MAKRLELDGLAIIPVEGSAAATLCFAWEGRSAARNPSELLAPFFDDVLAEAGATGAAVEMRFDRLTHFNSSTVTALLTFIEDARQHGVRVVLVYDGNTKWQRMSFSAMRVLSKGDGLFELRAL